MIKVCIICSNLGLGGPQEMISNLSRNIDKSIFEVHVVSLMNVVYDKYKYIFAENNIRLHILNKKNGHFSFRFLRLFDRTIKTINPDIISSHVTSLLYCCLSKSCKSIPIVHTIHSIPSLDQSKIKRFLIKKHVKNDHVSFVGCSKTIAEMASCLYNKKIEFINNGVDINNNDICIDKEYDYLVASRLTKMKRIDFIIESLKDLLKNSDKKLAIAGDGPEYEKLVELKARLNIKNILFLGRVDKMSDVYNKTKILLMASEWEGNPMNILEAMSFGIPTIASDVGGIKDIIKSGYNGILYKYENKDEFLKGVSRLEQISLYKSMSHNCLEESKKYSSRIMAEKYEKIFKEILNIEN